MSIHLKYLFNIFKKLNFYSRKTLHITGVGAQNRARSSPRKNSKCEKATRKIPTVFKISDTNFFRSFFCLHLKTAESRENPSL